MCCVCVQMMFGAGVSVAVQDPSYPVYVDSSVIMGMTEGYEQSHGGYGSIQYMVCRPETGFFPDLSSVSPCHGRLPCCSTLPGGSAREHMWLVSGTAHLQIACNHSLLCAAIAHLPWQSWQLS